jgi:hypothetical protein
VIVGVRVAVTVTAAVGVRDGAGVAVGVPVADRTDRLHPASTIPASHSITNDLEIGRFTSIRLSRLQCP